MGKKHSQIPVIRALSLSLLMTVLSALQAVALTCDPGLTPGSGRLGYQTRGDDQRCEGFYSSEVSNDDPLQLASITIGGLQFGQDGPDTLVIALPDLPELAPNTVLVRARSLPLRTYYRMDALLASGAALQWPLSDVVLPSKLASRQLGITGRVELRGRPLWIPLIVTAPSATPPGRDIVVIFRSPFDLKEVYWRERSGGAVEAEWELLDTDVWAGSPITLRLPDSNEPSRVVRLQISAQPEMGSNWYDRELHIWSPSQ